MAEVLGTAIGVVGFIGQLFDGCVKAYGYFTTAANLDADSQRMLCKVRIEEMRLVVWGREWGVAEGKFDEHLSERSNPQLRLLATQILEQLHSTVTDFKKLQDRYGLVDEALGKNGRDEVSPSRKGSRDEGRKMNGLKMTSTSSTTSERSWRKELGLRTKWVIGGERYHSHHIHETKGGGNEGE